MSIFPNLMQEIPAMTLATSILEFRMLGGEDIAVGAMRMGVDPSMYVAVRNTAGSMIALTMQDDSYGRGSARGIYACINGTSRSRRSGVQGESQSGEGSAPPRTRADEVIEQFRQQKKRDIFNFGLDVK